MITTLIIEALLALGAVKFLVSALKNWEDMNLKAISIIGLIVIILSMIGIALM